MRKLVYYIGVSLDGYIAGPGGEFEFYPTPPEYSGWLNGEFPEAIPVHLRPHFGIDVDTPNKNWDTMLMGRGTYAAAYDAGILSPFVHMKQYVFSSSLGPVDAPNIEIVDGDPVELVRELKQQEGLDIWLCGGGKLAGQLLDEIDQLIVKTYPVIAGEGIPAFTGVFKPTLFAPTRRKEFDSGAQVTWFDRS
ncbi:dihydrofolate reductase family protein [Nocardia salmonicida]|uniref:Dihydrofolate reductase family protein n=1 Tax=Nocardia salmonicida TaxID=53431 RepID=A0ABZ1NBD6_9NOCA|nr:dihydrofolate reductase family protein [Nocardia salmonicida]